MSIKGPSRRGEKRDHKAELVAWMNDGKPIPKRKVRKKRAVETKKRNMVEKKLEREIIWSLSMEGYKVAKSGEQSTYNSRYVLDGMSDLIVFVPKSMGESPGVVFMEVKTPTGKQRESQLKFESICNNCCVKYVVVRSVSEALKEVRK